MPGSYDNVAPSLVLNQSIVTQGPFPQRDGGQGHFSLGHVRTFGFDFEQGNFANGENFGIAANTALFAILGTTFGGNGQTTFALPNLMGTISVGTGQGPGLSHYDLGGTNGWNSFVVDSAGSPADVAAGGATIGNVQENLPMGYYIVAEGIFPSGNNIPMIGMVQQFAGNFAPNNTIPCDGRLLAISEFDVLFALIGTTYGGDGITTFGVPDLQGRTIVGAGNGLNVGDMFGGETATVGIGNLPGFGGAAGAGMDNHSPSLVLQALVNVQGIFPSRDSNASEDGLMVGEIIFSAVPGLVPRGMASASGQFLPIAQNQALFALFGTTFGGDGVTTFALPDLRGTAVMGAGNGFFVGEEYGSPTLSITPADLPAILVQGTIGTDSLSGGNLADTLNGRDGNDQLNGGQGNDTVNGGDGDDQLAGGDGADLIRGGLGEDTMSGGTGNDIYYVDNADDTVTEVFNGGSDEVRSTVDFTLGADVERLVLALTAANGTGNALNNVITAGATAATLNGLDGDDTLTGGAAADVVNGGEGSDSLNGRGGSDTLNGGNGNDMLFGESGADILNGDDGNDILLGADGVDTLNGGLGDDALAGGASGDIVNGGDGNDMLEGNSGADQLFGEAGNDVLRGGEGRDIATGGTGADIFSFFDTHFAGLTGASADRIMDFSQVDGDTISLEGIDAVSATAGDDAFLFIGSATFTGLAGELRSAIVGGNTLITGDIDGDSVADFMIRLDGIHNLVATDFVL